VHRRLTWLPLLILVGVVLFSPRIAFSAPKDAAATKLADDAINNDYLATNFAEAEKKLRSALTMCGTSACTAQVRARLYRDLGVVLVAGMNRAEDGRKALVEALKADPNIALEKDLTTPEVEAAFQAAKGGGSAPASATKPPAASAGGDMVHTPVAEQTVLTPVPIYAELGDGVNAVKVIARYKAFGTTEWKTLELTKLGNGYGAEVPCQEVGSTTGDLSYYLQATDGQGDVVATSGTRNAPNKVAIKSEIAGEAPHLPGKPAPTQCKDKADCPPGFPGCSAGKKKTGGNKSWGDACQKDVECGEGLACKSGQCEAGDKTDVDDSSPDHPCETAADCDAGDTCNADKLCESPTGRGKKLWLSLHVQPDLSFVSSQDDVCGSPTKQVPNSILCQSADGTDYLGVPDKGAVGDKRGNALKGGTHLATTRILLGLDYLASSNISLGLRLGYAFGAAPGKSLAAIHAEVRANYWLGKNPFRKTSLRPYVGIFGGLAEVDDKFTIAAHECVGTVVINGDTIDCNKLKPPGTYPPTQDLTVYHRSGGTFAGLAGGVMIPIGPKQGVMAEIKIQALFPNSGFAVSPSIGYAFGL
jgi:hypothetical protein